MKQSQPEITPELFAVLDRLAAIGRQRRKAAKAAGQELPVDPARAKLIDEVMTRLKAEWAEHGNTK